jgi:arylsulfatase A-like enzyme
MHALVALVALSRAVAGQCLPTPTPSDVGPTNVLMIVADDVGTDMLGTYGTPDHAPTPVLDWLASNGVQFTRAYANPLCSPTRASMLTGRYGFRTHIGAIIRPGRDEYALPLEEITLPEVFAAGTGAHIATAAIGKWHLGSPQTGGALNPNLQGFEWFEGTLGNFIKGENYFSHLKVTNGVERASTTYATTEQVDDALARIGVLREPWFVYLGFNAAHGPFHAPPAKLHTFELSGPARDTPHEHCRAMVQALDTEVGRLLAGINPALLANTTIVFIGDNGSASKVISDSFDASMAKDTLFEGGVHVPLIIAGKHVVEPGRICSALVNAVDLFPTALELAGGAVNGLALPAATKIDGVSLVPLLADPHAPPPRAWVYAEHFYPNGQGPYIIHSRMVRDERWKLIDDVHRGEQFFDVGQASQEGASLPIETLSPAQQSAYAHLKQILQTLTQG